MNFPIRPHPDFIDLKSNEQTRRTTPEPRLSSPFVDPNSLNFLPFTNQPHNLFTPNSIGFNGNFHSQQAGDLHTPMGLNMMTPLPFSNQLASVAPMDADATAMGINQFGQQFFSSPFQNTQSFAQQPSFAPSAFHHDSAYDAMDESVENSSLNELELQDPSTKMPALTVGMASQGDYKNGESEFRFNTTLRAPTAMIRTPRDIPITYLNKGQAYSLSLADSGPPLVDSKMLRYRTFIRVTFQDKEQRMKQGACWQLWKEGRGMSEAHQRHGKVQAVEYVDPFQGGNEDRKDRQVQVESTSIDGFCVTWTANPNTGASECTIPVRFNFLSTDFSHSKGVKGIPVRLCAKTQLVSNVDGAEADQEAELNFCQVKLFRDHGAERKLSNDVAHVKKTIEKLKQQIAQAEMGGGNNGKRKRTNTSVAFNGADHRPPKISKHKRTWSMDSRDADDKVSLEDDLHDKLSVMQEMFSSTRPTSSLNMQGDKQDDPDLFPVQLPNDDAHNSSKNLGLQALRGTQPSFDAPVPSPASSSSRPFTSQQTNTDSGYQTSLSSRSSSLPGSDFSLSHPVKVQRINSESNSSAGYIEAVDFDPTYRPPAERRIKPSKLRHQQR